MKAKKLLDCCEFISDGDHLPPPKSTEGVPFITISNITGQNKISFDDTMFVPESYYNGLSKTKKVRKGDILYSVVGSFGKPVYVDFDVPMVFQRHIAILRPKSDVNGRFLYYTMLNPQFYKMVDKLAIGCSQRTVTLDTLRNIEICLPNKDIQDKTVEVLALIDDKIERNNEINDNLEQQAKLLYNYWFTQFDFPDENGKPYRSSGGQMVWNDTLKREIPLGWEAYNIKQLTTITWGQCPDGANILPIDTIEDDVLDYCSGAGDMKNGFVVKCKAKTNGSKRLSKANDILVSIAGKIGDMCVVDHTISLGRAAMAFSANNPNEHLYLYITLSLLNKKMTTISSGSIQKVINSNHIDEFNFAYNQQIVKKWSSKYNLIFSQLISLSQENERLITFRDWLLPMLMNGQATVSD